jgi:hypothetical protein
VGHPVVPASEVRPPGRLREGRHSRLPADSSGRARRARHRPAYA